MRNLIRELKGEHTVLVSSHILSEISQVCDRLLVIQGGEIVAQGTEEQLAKSLGGAGAIEIDVRGTAQAALDAIQRVPGVASAQLLKLEGLSASLRVDAPPDLRPELVKALVAANIDVLRIDKAQGRLENIFMKLTGGKT